jgi:hypothetical protein
LLNGTKTDYKWKYCINLFSICKTDVEKDTKVSMLYSWKKVTGFDIGPKERKWEFVVVIQFTYVYRCKGSERKQDR